MKRLYKQLLALGTFLAIGTVASITFANDYHHINDLASAIERETRQLARESFRFRHLPQYEHLANDLRGMQRHARRLIDGTRRSGNVWQIRADLARLDSCLHHVENLVRQIEQTCGIAHIHARNRNLHRLIHSIEDDLHHIQQDLGRINQGCYECRPYERQHYNPYQGQSFGFGGFSLNRNGLVIRNGKMGFNIGF